MLRGRPTAGCCVSSRPVPGGEYAGCVRLPCSAGCVPACHAMPTALLISLPPFILLLCSPVHCHVRQDRHWKYQTTCLQAARLSRRQQQRGPAVAARAPCCVHYTVTGAARLPVGSRPMETAVGQPMRRCPLPIKRGRPGTAFGQPAKFPTPSFREPETACEQPGSLLTFFSLQSP